MVSFDIDRGREKTKREGVEEIKERGKPSCRVDKMMSDMN